MSAPVARALLERSNRLRARRSALDAGVSETARAEYLTARTRTGVRGWNHPRTATLYRATSMPPACRASLSRRCRTGVNLTFHHDRAVAIREEMRMHSRRTAIVTATFPGGGAVAVPAPPNVTDSGWREDILISPVLIDIYPPIGVPAANGRIRVLPSVRAALTRIDRLTGPPAR